MTDVFFVSVAEDLSRQGAYGGSETFVKQELPEPAGN